MRLLGESSVAGGEKVTTVHGRRSLFAPLMIDEVR